MSESISESMVSLSQYSKADRNHKCILHVDDDPLIHRLVAKQLSKDGIESIPLTDPRETFKTIVDKGIRVVLLDIDMPHMDGLSVLRKIKTMDAGVQVIMCTGMVSLTTVFNSTAFGAEGCVFKPLTDLELVSEMVRQSFAKIDRWWNTFDHWLELRRQQKSLDPNNPLYDSLRAKYAPAIPQPTTPSSAVPVS